MPTDEQKRAADAAYKRSLDQLAQKRAEDAHRRTAENKRRKDKK